MTPGADNVPFLKQAISFGLKKDAKIAQPLHFLYYTKEGGAEVFQESELLPQFGPVLGKGDAMWRALSVLGGETVNTAVEKGAAYSNPVAAMPSLHAAIPMMLVLLFWFGYRSPMAGVGCRARTSSNRPASTASWNFASEKFG